MGGFTNGNVSQFIESAHKICLNTMQMKQLKQSTDFNRIRPRSYSVCHMCQTQLLYSEKDTNCIILGYMILYVSLLSIDQSLLSFVILLNINDPQVSKVK